MAMGLSEPEFVGMVGGKHLQGVEGGVEEPAEYGTLEWLSAKY